MWMCDFGKIYIADSQNHTSQITHVGGVVDPDIEGSVGSRVQVA